MDLTSLVITPHRLNLIAGIDEFKGEWRALHTLTRARLQSLRHVATIESIGSSTRIEGSKLSDEEIEKLLGGAGTQSFSTKHRVNSCIHTFKQTNLQEMKLSSCAPFQLCARHD